MPLCSLTAFAGMHKKRAPHVANIETVKKLVDNFGRKIYRAESDLILI